MKAVRSLVISVMNGAVFHRLEGRSVSNNQGSASSASPALLDSASNDVYHSISVPRAVAYDGDQRYSRLQRDGLVSRRDKSTAHLQEESQPLRRTTSTSEIEPLGSNIKRRNGAESEEDCKIVHQLEPAGKPSITKVIHGLDYKLRLSEDEDVCPTCLDEYTLENPKIMTGCSHHFHLGCIYEWMERNESCPICGKEMEFCESL